MLDVPPNFIMEQDEVIQHICTSEDYAEEVKKGLPSEKYPSLCTLVRGCLCSDPKQRPTMAQVFEDVGCSTLLLSPSAEELDEPLRRMLAAKHRP